MILLRVSSSFFREVHTWGKLSLMRDVVNVENASKKYRMQRCREVILAVSLTLEEKVPI